MREKFNHKDIKFIITCLLIGAASTYFALSYFRQAFPEASINLNISKEEGKKQAEQFIANRGWDISNHIHGSGFSYHDFEKTILERYFDAETAGRIYNKNVGYFWQYRWFKPGQKEEYRVQIKTTGTLHKFEHIIPDSTHSDSLSRDIAYEKAQFYITGTLGFDPDEWKLMEETGTDRPNRYDYYFEWEEKDFYQKNGLEIKDVFDENKNTTDILTSHRISITIQGSEVSKYHEWIKHPEVWEREYQNLRSHNWLLNSIGGFFLNGTLLVILVVILIRTRKKDIRWKTALSYGGVLAILFSLYVFNQFPQTLLWVDSSQSLLTLIFTKIILDGILVPCIQGSLIIIIIAGGEVYYRDKYPDQVAFRNIFSVSGIKTKYFFNSAILGLTLTALFFAYQILFYLISNHLGGWSPTEVPNINVLGTYIPWVGVLLWGLWPAVSEEGISRLFSIPFLQKHAKSTVFAVLASSLIWGLAHAGYPAQPFYIRAIEVGLGGVFISIIFLRFGILPALIWHFTIDAVYGAMILLRSDDAYMFTSGLLCAGFFFLPLAYSMISYYKNGGFFSTDPLVNALDTQIPDDNLEKVTEQDEAKIKTEYKPLSYTRKKIGIVVAAVSILLTVFISRDNDLENLINFNTTRNEAYSNAVEFLTDKDIDISDFDYVIKKESDITGRNKGIQTGRNNLGGSNLKIPQYIIENTKKDSMKTASEIIRDVYTKHESPHQWNVRFYKPGVEKEYEIDIDVRNGAVTEYETTLADTAFISSVDVDSALIIAEEELEEKWGFDKDIYSLKEINSEVKENRTDHKITFQSEEFVGKARYLYEATVQGNNVGSVYKIFWIPEEWELEYEKPTLFTSVRIFYLVFIWIIFSIFIFVTVLRLLRNHDIPWKYISFGGLAFVAVELIDYINDSASLMSYYKTERLIAQYIVSNVLYDYILGLAIVLFYCIIIVVAVYMMWPGFYNTFLKKNRQQYLQDALTTSFVAGGFLALIKLFNNLISTIFTDWIPFSSLASRPSDTFFPGLNLFVIILAGVPFWALVAIALFYLHRRYFSGKGPILSNLLIILFLMFFANGMAMDRELMLLPEFLVRGFWFICFLVLFRYFCRWNPWSYLLGIGIMWYGGDIMAYMQNYIHPTFQIQGWIGIGIGVLFFVYLAWLAFGSSSDQKHAISS